ncbi:hypothetical protein TWF506_010701 [Arthrobotrys conoides]|uniref:Uncharacterized protein n=1 Tax=Arthrobotrys conoides TaxID=74498 RepID=A0AAN8RSH6_9PEZI
MSSAENHSFFLDCPPEIHLEIVDHLKGMLDGKTLKRFSQASKLCRTRALPALFTGLWLNREAVAAFSEGGALSWVRPFVHKNSLQHSIHLTPTSPKWKNLLLLRPHRTSDPLRQILTLFPSVENISTIPDFGIPSSIQNNLSIALWRAISALPNIKNITIFRTYLAQSREFRDPTGPKDPYKAFLLKLSPEAIEFLGPEGILNPELANGVSMPQQSFETINIETSDLQLQTQPGFFSRSFFFGNSGENLKSLDLHIHSRLTVAYAKGCPTTIVFPNVTKLRLQGNLLLFRESSGRIINWFSEACPNVESFRLWTYKFYDSGISLAEYMELTPMNKLQVLEIPWPRGEEDRSKQQELNNLIRQLISAGLESLENITFIRIPPWAGYSNEYIFRKCRIDRSEGGRGIRIWWKKSYRYLDVKLRDLTPDQTEFDEGNDSGDDLDENPPGDAHLNTYWMQENGRAA